MTSDKKKVMVRCDLEGLTGVVSNDQVQMSGSEYDFGRRMLLHDLLALVEGLDDAGVDEVVLYDVHATGRNVDLEQLPPHVAAICGKPPYRADWPGGLDDSFAGMILLGLHGKAGAAGGILPHSFEGAVADIRLHGESVGEIGVEAAVAGDCGVPTILVVADSVGAEEAQALLPAVHTVAVKESLGETGGLCYPPVVTREWIRAGAEKALRAAGDIPPFIVPGPVRMEVELQRGQYQQIMHDLFPDEFSAENIVALEQEMVTAAFARWWQMSKATYAEMGRRAKA